MEEEIAALRAELDALRSEFNAFKAYATPVIDNHQVNPDVEALTNAGGPIRPPNTEGQM